MLLRRRLGQDVATPWAIEWRDDSPALALPSHTGANHTAAEIIVAKVREVLAAR